MIRFIQSYVAPESIEGNGVTKNAKENIKNMTPEAVAKQICDALNEVIKS